jgi:hypothetical protein
MVHRSILELLQLGIAFSWNLQLREKVVQQSLEEWYILAAESAATLLMV